MGLLTGLCCSTALSNDALRVPGKYNSNIELTLQGDQAKNLSEELFQVFVGGIDECCADKTPMAGDYLNNGLTMTFDPAYDFIEGQNYTVMIGSVDNTERLEPVLTEFYRLNGDTWLWQ